MKIAIGNDHAGLSLKEAVIEHLKLRGHDILDLGTNETSSCDYPEFGQKVAMAVVNGDVRCGVLICGTGVGISMAANKVRGARCAVCSESATARLAKEHNDANIIAFGSRIVGEEAAKDILDAYLNATFQGGRHQRRIDLIHRVEREQAGE